MDDAFHVLISVLRRTTDTDGKTRQLLRWSTAKLNAESNTIESRNPDSGRLGARALHHRREGALDQVSEAEARSDHN